jgi:hypothetical protein
MTKTELILALRQRDRARRVCLEVPALNAEAHSGDRRGISYPEIQDWAEDNSVLILQNLQALHLRYLTLPFR